MSRKTKSFIAMSLLALLLVASAPLGLNGFPISPVVDSTDHMTEWRSAAAFSSGSVREYLVVWEQFASDYVNESIYGRFVFPDGRLHGSSFIISPAMGGNELADIAYNPDLDQFLVVYGRDQAGIYARTVTHAHGLGAERVVQMAGAGEYVFTPAVEYSPTSDRYVVTWTHRYGVSTQAIEARTLLSNGTTPGALMELSGKIAFSPSEPDIAWSAPLNEFLVVWQKSAGTDNYDIVGRRILAGSATPLSTPEFTILLGPKNENYPQVGALTKTDGAGQFLVVCQAYTAGTTSYAIAGQRVTDTGGLEGGRVDSIGAGEGYTPAVAGSSLGREYLVAWEHEGTNVQARTMSLTGGLGREYTLNGIGPYNLAIAAGPGGDFLLTVDDWAIPATVDIVGYLWGNRMFLPLVRR